MRDHSFKAPRRPVLLSGLLLAAGVLIGIVMMAARRPRRSIRRIP